MIALNYLCREFLHKPSIIGSATFNFRFYSLSSSNGIKTIVLSKPSEFCNGRSISGQMSRIYDQQRQQSTTTNHQSSSVDAISPYLSNETSESSSGDWFENRYLDKSCHARDGLNPNEWLLLYRLADEGQRNRMMFSLYAISLGAIICGTLIFVVTFVRRDDNPFQVAPAFLLVGGMGFVYATRLRRYGVLRMYASRADQEAFERWRLEQLQLAPSQRSISAPVRNYRIVWSDMFNRPKMFAYNSRQISDGIHRKTWMSRTMNGNFLVLGRPWAVHPENFDEAPDYIFVRRSV